MFRNNDTLFRLRVVGGSGLKQEAARPWRLEVVADVAPGQALRRQRGAVRRRRDRAEPARPLVLRAPRHGALRSKFFNTRVKFITNRGGRRTPRSTRRDARSQFAGTSTRVILDSMRIIA